jgi:hypothetical protein
MASATVKPGQKVYLLAIVDETSDANNIRLRVGNEYIRIPDGHVGMIVSATAGSEPNWTTLPIFNPQPPKP